jgi:hypothetical protein
MLRSARRDEHKDHSGNPCQQQPVGSQHRLTILNHAHPGSEKYPSRILVAHGGRIIGNNVLTRTTRIRPAVRACS